MRNVLVTALIVFFASQTMLHSQPSDALSGSLKIVPDNNFVTANLTYQYVPRSSADTTATFYLPRTITVTSLKSPTGNRYEEIVDTTTYVGKLFKTLVVSLDTSSQQPVAIRMQYEGTVDLHTLRSTGTLLPKHSGLSVNSSYAH